MKKRFCLIDTDAQKFLKMVRDGDISYSKLNSTTKARESLFKSIFDEETAKKLNIEFEKSTLRKSRLEGYKDFIKKMTGADKAKRERIIQKVQEWNKEKQRRVFSPKEDEMFLEEVVKEKLGIGVSREEARVIFDLSRIVDKGEELLNKNRILQRFEDLSGVKLTDEQSTSISEIMDKLLGEKMRKTETQSASRRIKSYLEKGNNLSDTQKQEISKYVDDVVSNRGDRIKYATAKIALDDLIGAEKLANLPKYSELKKSGQYRKYAMKLVRDSFGFAKTAKSTLDASFGGRQGRVAFLKAITSSFVGNLKPMQIFGKIMKTNFGTLYKKGLKGEDALRAVRIGIAARDNSINGLYDLAKLDVGVSEEAFPSSVLDKVQLVKGANDAYTASAYMMRAEYFDYYIDIARKNGVELDKKQLEAIGSFVNSMSGRGKEGIGKLGEKTNLALFSPKFFQSTLDTLTAETFKGKSTSFTRAEARKNLAQIVVGVSGILAFAEIMRPGSVEKDPRSSDFGKIKIGDRRFDVTGGLGSVVTLASRTGLFYPLGKLVGMDLSAGTKSTTTGAVTKPGEFNGKDIFDLLSDTLENKLSPAARALVTAWNGENFDRQPMWNFMEEPYGVAWRWGKELFIPIPLASPIEVLSRQKDNNEPGALFLAGTLADFVGISSNTYSFSEDWSTSKTKEAEKLVKQYGFGKVKDVSKQYSKELNLKLLKFRDKEEFRNASDEVKKSLIDKLKDDTKKEVLRKNAMVVPKDNSFEKKKQNLEEEKLYRNLLK